MSKLLKSVVGRNSVGVLALLVAYYIPDRFSIESRDGLNKILPYIFLVLMYGWIIFHNRVLFEGLYLRNKKPHYFFWALGLMAVSSINMHLVIRFRFGDVETLSKILSFWVFTLTGLGIYVMFKFLHVIENKPKAAVPRVDEHIEFFNCTIDGIEKKLPLRDIIYLESLENYVKVHTKSKTYIVRLSMKEAEQRLPKSFLRISRSHIVNIQFVEANEGDSLKVNGEVLKVGKVYKRYVEEVLGYSIKA